MAKAFELKFNDKKAKKFFSDLSIKHKQAVDKHKKLGALMSPFVFKDIMQHFNDEKGPQGKWQSWSDSYKDFMSKIGKSGNKILQDSGRLRQSFLPTNFRKTKDGYLWFNPAKTKDGFPYAYAHDTGGTQLPQRQFMWLSDKAMNRISKLTLAFILGQK